MIDKEHLTNWLGQRLDNENWNDSDSSLDTKNLPMCIPDSDRKKLNDIAKILEKDPVKLQAINNLRNRSILFIGSENQKHPKIKVKQEYKKLFGLLVDKEVSIDKSKPDLTSIIIKWNLINPHVIIFSCHGEEGVLHLKDEEGNDLTVTAVQIKDLLAKRSNHTECVILSACVSLNIGKLILPVANNVVAINKKVSITTARKFTKSFIKYLAENPHKTNDVYKKAFSHSKEIATANNHKDASAFEFLESGKIQ